MSDIDVSQVSVTKDVVYGQGGGRDLRCDVHRPPAALNKHVAVLQLHGGGFRGGSKEGTRIAGRLAGLGYTSVASEYRLLSEARWPAQIEDVRTALAWIEANAADLDIDPAKIVILGHSAGGNLALVAAGSSIGGNGAATRTKIAACVAFYPPAEASRGADGAPPPVFPDDAGDDLIRSGSPISYVQADFPPTILLHGSADTTLPVVNSFRLYEAFSAAGVPVELHILEGLEHVFDGYPEFAELTARTVDLFLDRKVVNPREYPSSLGRAAAR